MNSFRRGWVPQPHPIAVSEVSNLVFLECQSNSKIYHKLKFEEY